MDEFLTDYVMTNKAERIGYLAQHPIFEQIPQLSKDILTPLYAEIGGTGDIIRMIWMGPQGTVTPLHTDPYHNFYVQIRGSKYVRLYSPDCTPHLKVIKEGILTNTSSLPADILKKNIDFPTYEEIPYEECILRRGDALFFPAGWWHFLKSLEPSISLSFWFN
eukprot:GHVL01014255.1.p1 GENE.GHVL01014255.1~~GHVL01014255.1.p1  ORF type:complete len:163 (-),score=24.80 GHVL01014255.1:37-525(-)